MTALFVVGLASTVAGIAALLSIPAAAIALGLTLMTVAVLIERARAADSDAVGDAAETTRSLNPKEYPHA